MDTQIAELDDTVVLTIHRPKDLCFRLVNRDNVQHLLGIRILCPHNDSHLMPEVLVNLIVSADGRVKLVFITVARVAKLAEFAVAAIEVVEGQENPQTVQT